MVLASVSKLVLPIALAFPNLLGADDSSCADHRELIAASSEQLPTMSPCDLIGATYLAGFGISSGNPSVIDETSNIDTYKYYPLFRSYLAARRDADQLGSDEALGYLLLGVSVLPQISASAEKESLRGNYYSSFAVVEFWENDLIGKTNLPLLFEDALLEWMETGQFRNTHQLKCFVLHDIPTVPIDEVTSSRRFIDCIGGS